VVRAFRLIAYGLRANANRELGHFDAEAQAIQARLAILEERREESRIAWRSSGKKCWRKSQLALNASQRNDAAAAANWLNRALARADDLHARAHGVRDKEQLDVIWLAAELTVSMRRMLVANLEEADRGGARGAGRATGAFAAHVSAVGSKLTVPLVP